MYGFMAKSSVSTLNIYQILMRSSSLGHSGQEFLEIFENLQNLIYFLVQCLGYITLRKM